MFYCPLMFQGKGIKLMGNHFEWFPNGCRTVLKEERSSHKQWVVQSLLSGKNKDCTRHLITIFDTARQLEGQWICEYDRPSTIDFLVVCLRTACVVRLKTVRKPVIDISKNLISFQKSLVFLQTNGPVFELLLIVGMTYPVLSSYCCLCIGWPEFRKRLIIDTLNNHCSFSGTHI